MEYRYLGNSGLRVSAFCFGTMTFGGTGPFFSAVGKTQLDEARRLIDMSLEAGINLFDTADVYSAGQSEELLGTALGNRRHDVLVATKAVMPMGSGPNDCGASRHHLIRACEASLKRLNTDYIDLYQVHNQDAMTPPEETMRALDDLVRAGKVRYVGSSNLGAWYKMKSMWASDRLNLVRYISQQIQYSLIWRDAEDELIPVGVDQGVGALIWSPLAGGYLSGKFRSGDKDGGTRLEMTGRIDNLDNARTQAIIDAVEAIAAERTGVSAAQVALNWVVRKPTVSSIIIGARNETQLADNLAAANWSLTDEEIARLDAASALPPRYPYSHHRLAVVRNPHYALQPGITAPTV